MTAATWADKAWRHMRALAKSGAPFTSDDLIARAGLPDQNHNPNSANSAVGSLFRQAAAQGLIVSDGRVVKSRQKHRKGGAVRVWLGTNHGGS